MNIAQDYINYIVKKYKKILSILLGKNYVAKTTTLFLKEYINTRYYEKIDLDRIELKDTIIENLNDLKEFLSRKKTTNCIEKIIPCFNVIFYIDNVDKNIDIEEYLKELEDSEKKEVNNLIKEIENKRNKYFSLATDNKFTLDEQLISVINKINITSLSYDIKFSKLYSDYAIEKAYNSGTTKENKLFIEYTMTAFKILIAKFNNQKVGHYIIEFTPEILSKNKKLHQLIDIIDNPLIKNYISIKLLYSDYLKYTDSIQELIKKGINISLLLDDDFPCDKVHLEELVIFDKILIDMKYKCYDYIRNNKNDIKSNIFDTTFII